MAPTVGELLATITVDDAPAEADRGLLEFAQILIKAGLRRTEQGIRRTAQVIEDEAGRAGQAAGRELTDLIAERLTDARTEAGAAPPAPGLVGEIVAGAVAELRERPDVPIADLGAGGVTGSPLAEALARAGGWHGCAAVACAGESRRGRVTGSAGRPGGRCERRTPGWRAVVLPG